MVSIIQGAGVFIYPLGLCSVIAVFVIAERLLALRTRRILPQELLDALVAGGDNALPDNGDSVGARIVRFFSRRRPDAEAFKAYVRLELSRLERGVFVLDIIIAAAPLIGLLGTVVGLVQVFSANVSPDGVPETQAFVTGVSLALTTTVLGLAIAIPSLVFHGIIVRRIDLLAARLDMLAERLLETSRASTRQ